LNGRHCRWTGRPFRQLKPTSRITRLLVRMTKAGFTLELERRARRRQSRSGAQFPRRRTGAPLCSEDTRRR
jgi:hypothetical protein